MTSSDWFFKLIAGELERVLPASKLRNYFSCRPRDVEIRIAVTTPLLDTSKPGP
jgi:hypothetical protein